MEITNTTEDYIVYAAGGLYCDRGTVGEEDNADILVRGFPINSYDIRYYFGTENANLPAGEALTFTMDKAVWAFFYMSGPLTLNMNTSLTGNGFNGVEIGDTAESVLLTIGRVDGGTESYTINSSGLWYSKLIINKPFDSDSGISIKKGNDYNEDDITLNLDKSKYATEKNTDYWGKIYCNLKNVSAAVVNPDVAGSIDGTNMSGNILIFDAGGTIFAAVDTDKDGVLDDSENAERVNIGSSPTALPGSRITMLSGSLDTLSFYGEAFTQKGGAHIETLDVFPASASAAISQEASGTIGALSLKSGDETTAYAANSSCTINVEIGGDVDSVQVNNNAADIKLLATADPGTNGTFTFSGNSTSSTLNFSEYTLKNLDNTNGYYTDICYASTFRPVKPTVPANVKNITDSSSDSVRYCPADTTDAWDELNPAADFGKVLYGYDVSSLATKQYFKISKQEAYILQVFKSDYFDFTFSDTYTQTGVLEVTVRPKSGLEPGVYRESCSIVYRERAWTSDMYFDIFAVVTVTPQTVTVTPDDNLILYQGSGNTSWKQGYTLSPAVTLPDADKDLLVYYGEATVGEHELHLGKTCSSDNHYNFVLDTGSTHNLTISAYTGNQGYSIESAVAMVPDTWGTYAMITAPEGYLVSLTDAGTYTKSVKWSTSSTQPQDGIAYYIKDNTASHDSYLLSLQKTIDGVKVCTDGDLATYSSGTVTNTTSSTADVTFSLTLKDATAGACGISKVYVLAVPNGNAAPTVDTVLASGTAATENGSAYTVTMTGLSANTAYTFYAAHTTEAGVKAPNSTNIGNATTKGFAPTVTTSPNASGVYGTALSELSFIGGTVTGQNGVKLNGSWTWTQTDAGIIYPTVNDTTAYEATFTPGDTQYSPVTVQLKPTMMPAQISVTGAAAQGRSYEKDNTSVNITGVTLSDGISLSLGTDYTAAGVMTDDNAGENKAVTVTLT